MILCRLCAESDKIKSENLFQKTHKIGLLHKIKKITGCLLKDIKGLPNAICTDCSERLEEAYNFREKCLKSQKYFKSIAFEARKKITNSSEVFFQEDNEKPNKIDKEDSHSEDEHKVSCPENKRSKQRKQYKHKRTKANLRSSKDQVKEEEFVWDDSLVEEKLQISTVPESRSDEVAVVECQDQTDKSKSDEQTPSKLKCYICDQCGNTFTSQNHFRIHLRRHAGDKRHHCEICSSRFFTTSELKRHMRRHTGEKPYVCKYCGRCFGDYSTRTKHERAHSNERPFSCSQCGKAFMTSHVLKNHMLVHTGERPFSCSLCNKAFQRQTHLTVHYRSSMHKNNQQILADSQAGNS